MTVLCLFAHHRSASTWSSAVFRELCASFGWRRSVIHDAGSLPAVLASDSPHSAPDFVVFSNARPELLAALPAFRGVHLVRDPRDVLVSSYFAHRFSHPTTDWPELAAHRRELEAAGEEEGLLLELDCRQDQFSAMAAWPYGDERICEWRFEEVVARPVEHVERLLRQWGLAVEPRAVALSQAIRVWNKLAARLEAEFGAPGVPRWRSTRVDPRTLEGSIRRHDFTAKSGGRRPGETDPMHHYRSGLPGSWRQHFTPELRRRFRERYGELLVQLGYERTEDW